MKIRFGEVQISDLSKKHIQDCLDRNYVTMGPKTAALEKEWSQLFIYKNSIAVNSGTSACIAANIALYDFGAQAGDEVIVPALSFIATANAVRAAGFRPVFCDVRKETLLIDEAKVEDLITPKTRAIMPVTLMGKPPKMDVLKDIADRRGLKLIVDNCEGHGCSYQNEFMGGWGDASLYSCYAAHVLFSGELGFVSTDNDKFAEAVESIRSHGRKPKTLYFDHGRYGLNLKPTDIHASIGLGNVKDFDKIFETRRKNQKYFWEHLDFMRKDFWFSEEDEESMNSPHGFSFTAKPDADVPVQVLKDYFDKAGIEWKRNFGSMPTQHKCFEYLNYRLGDFPEAEYVGDNGIHIGVHQMLSQDDLQYVVDTIKKLY